jgi:hypothetical protein
MLTNTIAVTDIAKLVQFEFRRFGFRADGVRVAPREEWKSYMVEFDREPATGMAAFSQDWVEIGARIWSDPTPENTVPLKDEKGPAIELTVHYRHPAGGHNGYSQFYELKKAYLEDPVLTRR